MNEIIKELIDRCTTHYNGGLGTEIEVFDKEKFAELIVKECAHIAWANSTGYNISHTKIKEHFGVKE
jgi:hypothetical protein